MSSKSAVMVSRTIGGAINIDVSEKVLPSAMVGKRLSMAGPTIFKDGSFVIFVVVEPDGTTKTATFHRTPSMAPDRRVVRFSVKLNREMMKLGAFGLTKATLENASATRLEIRVPAQRKRPMLKGSYRKQAEIAKEVAIEVQKEEQIKLASPRPQVRDLFAAIDLVNELVTEQDRLFVNSDTGRLGVEQITRYGG